jgi:hypothetical protein
VPVEKEPGEDLWTWNELEVKQTYEEADEYAMFGAAFILN